MYVWLPVQKTLNFISRIHFGFMLGNKEDTFKAIKDDLLSFSVGKMFRKEAENSCCLQNLANNVSSVTSQSL